MDLRKITDGYSVSPQIEVADVSAIAAQGFRTIMCNRPDGEEIGQCDVALIEAEARAAGLEFCWLPVTSAGVSPETLEGFRTALDTMPGPVLAYCRSGTRCTMLWTLNAFGTVPTQEIVAATSAAGYDMSGVLAQLSRAG